MNIQGMIGWIWPAALVILAFIGSSLSSKLAWFPVYAVIVAVAVYLSKAIDYFRKRQNSGPKE
jgi:hypothetical protein